MAGMVNGSKTFPLLKRPSAARMVRAVNFLQILPVDVCIDLRRGDIRVAEHLLDGPKVGAPLEQMRGE